MKFGILGTGQVGRTIGSKLVALGHEVRLGSRTPDNEAGRTWATATGERSSYGTFADAAAFGEIVFNCTPGSASMAALTATDGNADGKVLVDVANPLDFSKGFPPRLSVCNDDSLGEQIQRAFPRLRVVKALNTVNCDVMVDPARIPGDHDLLICGDDATAKHAVASLLKEQLGWRHVIDLGGIGQARATEMYLALWVRLYGVLRTPDFNIHVVRG